MSLYNQYRPHTFGEILGQEQSIAILKKQAQAHAFHHAYLLYGPSGSGKTTTARVLAAALNCETMNGSGEPCGQCPSCQGVIKGNHWDVLEIDGGRFGRIDNCRDLCYKAYYSPLGKHKVYVIDECHQLSEEAWNALLKLLEEPPPHLVVILCTTNQDKIPDTIRSRCQQYPFAPLPTDVIKSNLERIASQKELAPDPNHMKWIAETACGNMRTALNTLEQVSMLVR